MSTQALPPNQNQPATWPPDAAPYYRPTLFLAVAACAGRCRQHRAVGRGVGVQCEWLRYRVLGVSTAILGFVSGVALFTLLFFTSTLLDVKWAAPLSLGVFVAGVACLTAAVLTIVRVVSIPEEDLLGVLLGARVGWGYGS